MIFFTSDTHYWHKHIIGYCQRPFESVEAMNEGLIDRWNSQVHQTDTVYFIGDFAFCGTTKARAIFDRLKGTKHLILGNHDYETARKLPWESIHDYKLIRPHIEYQRDDGEVLKTPHPIVLCHFPILSWDGMAHGSWHLHGHCHGSLKDTGALRLDVGVDAHKWYPISLEEVQAHMALRTVVPVDHHKPGMRANPA
jgi:calcineurin-like phosphoesterase family protein